MGHGKIGVSDFTLTVSAAIRAQMGIRRISNREIAKLIDRGATYVNSRIKDENEWALGDIEKTLRTLEHDTMRTHRIRQHRAVSCG